MNFSRIFCNLKSNDKFLLSFWKIPKIRRTFLSEAYQCRDQWNDRFNDKLLKDINISQLYFELKDKIENKQIIRALDVDILVNCIQDNIPIDDVVNIIHKLRMTKETSNTFDSTHHAVVRYFIDNGKSEELLTILNDRLNYGIFCDYFSYNLLMDHFIENKKFASAAKVASFMMLQEEFEHPISNHLAIYSCHNYLKDPDTWQEVDPETLKEEPVEEVKIRVKYLRNPYFDDHFDLWKPSDLVGKTLYWIGKVMDDPLGRTCQLRGSILYKKYADAISLLETWKQDKTKQVIYKDVLSLIKKDVPQIFSDDATELDKTLQMLLLDLENADLYERNLDDDITNSVKEAVKIQSEKDILEQTEIYKNWYDIRTAAVNAEICKLEKQQRLNNIKQMKEDLIKQERILTFFDNQDLIELKIQKKLEKEKRLYGVDTTQKHMKEYVPLEIVKET